ncbi:hypothetical protein DIPPA_16333 [Diplonema papillatum]|nr:hypothetical protein DIPPA_16333 [Diplonema papillatum]
MCTRWSRLSFGIPGVPPLRKKPKYTKMWMSAIVSRSNRAKPDLLFARTPSISAAHFSTGPPFTINSVLLALRLASSSIPHVAVIGSSASLTWSTSSSTSNASYGSSGYKGLPSSLASLHAYLLIASLCETVFPSTSSSGSRSGAMPGFCAAHASSPTSQFSNAMPPSASARRAGSPLPGNAK